MPPSRAAPRGVWKTAPTRARSVTYKGGGGDSRRPISLALQRAVPLSTHPSPCSCYRASDSWPPGRRPSRRLGCRAAAGLQGRSVPVPDSNQPAVLTQGGPRPRTPHAAAGIRAALRPRDTPSGSRNDVTRHPRASSPAPVPVSGEGFLAPSAIERWPNSATRSDSAGCLSAEPTVDSCLSAQQTEIASRH